MKDEDELINLKQELKENQTLKILDLNKLDDFIEQNNIDEAYKILKNMKRIEALRYILLRDNVELLEYLFLTERKLFKDIDAIKYLCKKVYFSDKCLELLNNIDNRPDLKI